MSTPQERRLKKMSQLRDATMMLYGSAVALTVARSYCKDEGVQFILEAGAIALGGSSFITGLWTGIVGLEWMLIH